MFDPNTMRGYAASQQDYVAVFPPKGITPRRLSAAKNALKRQRDKHPLFADDIAKEQPTPEERILGFDARHEAIQRETWDRHKAQWADFAIAVGQLHEADRELFVSEWNTAPTPCDLVYAKSHFAKFLQGTRAGAFPRTDIGDPELRAMAEKIEKTLSTLRDIRNRATSENAKSYTTTRINEELAKLREIEEKAGIVQ